MKKTKLNLDTIFPCYNGIIIPGNMIKTSRKETNTMTQSIYAIKDKAIGFYQVFMASNDYGAQRYCNDLTVQENTFYNKHAKDLDLYKLTELDTDTGDTKKDLKFICNLEIFKEKAEAKLQ